jgi:hypothetical protein
LDALAVTPMSADLAFASVKRNPSAASPRLSNSGTGCGSARHAPAKRQSPEALISFCRETQIFAREKHDFPANVVGVSQKRRRQKRLGGGF